jgi:hypothetical protein
LQGLGRFGEILHSAEWLSGGGEDWRHLWVWLGY